MMRVEFQGAEAIGLDFIDAPDGFLFLRMVGPETLVNAIWAYLSNHDPKKQKADSKVLIWPSWNVLDTEHVMTEKSQRYRMIRTRLPCGAVDMVLIHPLLTASEDTERRFFLLTYDPGVPDNFFGRLNRALSTPLKPDWTTWLWEIGQRPHTWWTLIKRNVYQHGKYVLRDELTEETRTPISQLPGWGEARCYEVQCDGLYEECWIQIIRNHLGLARRLKPARIDHGDNYYTHDDFVIYPNQDGSSWSLRQRDTILLRDAPSLNFLIAQARRDLGEHFVLSDSSPS